MEEKDIKALMAEHQHERKRNLSAGKKEYLRASKAWREKRGAIAQEKLYSYMVKWNAYMEEQERKGEPMTIAGMILAGGLTKDRFARMRSGEYDHLLQETIDRYGIDYDECLENEEGLKYWVHPSTERVMILEPISEMCERMFLKIEEQAEMRLYARGRSGDVFALKAKHRWQDTSGTQVTNNTLVIADEKQARKAIEMLK